jgi:TPR repeat protein
VWFTKAADHGDPEGQLGLGRLYDDLDPDAHDYAQAARWYALAAEQNDAAAQYYLGRFYFRGYGVATDDARGLALMTASAEQDFVLAQVGPRLSLSRRPRRAARLCQVAALYKAAAATGDRDALYGLGVAYAEGLGVPADFKQSFAYYLKAAQLGDEARRPTSAGPTTTARASRPTARRRTSGTSVRRNRAEPKRCGCWLWPVTAARIAQSWPSNGGGRPPTWRRRRRRHIGIALSRWQGVPQDFKESLSGIAMPPTWVAWKPSKPSAAAYFGGGRPIDDAEAVKWYRPRRGLEGAYGLTGLGNAYDKGRGFRWTSARPCAVPRSGESGPGPGAVQPRRVLP